MSEKIHAGDVEAQLSNGFSTVVTQSVDPSQLQALIDSHNVLMFSKSTCPFCFELKRLLSSYGVHYKVFEVDKVSNTAALQDKLKEISGIRTAPNLFLDGKSVGGCTTFKGVEFSLDTRSVIGKYMGTSPIAEEERIRYRGLFYFPPVVNGHVVRMASGISLVVAILCVALYNYPATKWVALGLAIDYLLRLVFGGSYSLAGQFAAAALVNMKPKWSAGPPKQFAAFCGLFMSTVGALLFLLDIPIGGAVMFAGLSGAASLETFFDFCLGCWIFGHGIALGIISPQVYRPYLTERDSRIWGYNFVHAKNKFDTPAKVPILVTGQTYADPVTIMRKERNEVEYKFAHPDVIGHSEVSLFLIPTAVAMLAFQFQLVGHGASNIFDGTDFAEWGTMVPYQVLYVLSVVLIGIISILYLLKTALHWQKVVKEWNNPLQGNAFIAIPVCLILYGVMYVDRDKDFAAVLIWMGAVIMMAITFVRTADLMMYRLPADFINPVKLMLPIGNFLAAIGFGVCDSEDVGHYDAENWNYLFLSRVWFGAGLLLSVILLPATFRQVMVDHLLDERLRPYMWLWGALTSVAAVAVLVVSGMDPAVGRGVVCQSLWGASLYLFGSFSLLWLRGYFSYIDGSNGIWAMAFSTSAFSLSTIFYYFMVDHFFMRVFTIITITASCAMTAVCGCHALAQVLDLSMFRSTVRWGPLSFMALTHEMLRFVVPKMSKQIVEANFADSPAAMDALVKDLSDLLTTYLEHGRHEEEVLFPFMRRYYPNLNLDADQEHDFEHRQVDQMLAAIKAYKDASSSSSEGKSNSNGKALLSALQEVFPAFSDHLMKHLRSEEATFTVIARKIVPFEHMVEINRRVFDLGTAETWATVMPFMVRMLPMPAWKVRYVKTFLVANHNRAQEIGLMIYRGVDSGLWTWISSEIPDIIPRGLPGYRKQY